MSHQSSTNSGPKHTRRRFSRPTKNKNAPESAIKRAITASALGNATEWFDYGVYAVATSYIAQHFFESFSHPRLLTLATFAVSFIVRPLGGFIWGPLGDKLGRKTVLTITILMMSGATFLIGVLPTYQLIGAWAPFLLILLRIVQGFSTGGEYSGAATFMGEYAPDKRRGFFGSFLEFGSLSGYAAGSGIMLLLETVLSSDQMQSWGWRIPFLVALPLGLVGFYLRTRLEDTPVFKELKEKQATTEKESARQESKARSGDPDTAESPSLVQLMKWYWQPLLIMGGMVTAVNIINYTLLTYMPTYFEQQLGLSATAALSVILIGEVAMVAFMPISGRLSDRFGRKTNWYISLIGIGIVAIPLFWLMGKNIGLAIAGYAILGLLFIMQLGTISATFTAMFPTHVRSAGFAISYNVATAIFGGTAGLISDFFIDVTGSLLVPAFYMTLGCVVGLVSVYFMTETAGASLHGEDVPGSVGSAVVEGSPAYEALESGQQPEQRNMTEDEMRQEAKETAQEAEEDTAEDDGTDEQGQDAKNDS